MNDEPVGVEQAAKETMIQADARKHTFPFPGGPCVFCGVFQQNAEYDVCRLEQSGAER
ncbi:hypothetical protein JNB62_05490 [Microbacterium jejuense]|uniref:Uncharacterized protein n=1 Tax=Microbacterium jejuense TaxID=1263637 RepID=A0ABS7HM49_9MICO|nr:hypothetical protein [Microbacterium jejuense]MBW9093129.1 hypothetical protein [Microbacterium jejuense]